MVRDCEKSLFAAVCENSQDISEGIQKVSVTQEVLENLPDTDMFFVQAIVSLHALTASLGPHQRSFWISPASITRGFGAGLVFLQAVCRQKAHALPGSAAGRPPHQVLRTPHGAT